MAVERGGVEAGRRRDGWRLPVPWGIAAPPRPVALPPSLALLGAAFLVSGFCALVYQTVWQRMLGLFAGSDAVATTLVVGAFLFGLGVGSVVGAAIADRLRPGGAVLAFAGCELGTAAFALASRALFYDLLFQDLAPAALEGWAAAGIVVLALLVPTTLMGMSLPLLARAAVDRIETAASRIGRLYGLNVWGAALGVLLAGFVLIGELGLERTVHLAAGLNLLVGGTALLAWKLARWDAPAAAAQAAPAAAAATGVRPLPFWLWCGLVFASGFLVISLEILWFRVLGALMRASTYAFPLILGVFLAGDALGTLAGARLVRRLADPRRLFHVLQGAVALEALLALLALWAAHALPEVPKLFVLSRISPLRADAWHLTLLLALQAGLVLLVVLPPAFLLGLAYPVSQKGVQDDPNLVGRRVGLLQLANILGNSLGAVLTGLLLLDLLGSAGTLRLLGGLGLLFLGAALLGGPAPGAAGLRIGRPAVAALAVALLLTIAVFPTNTAFWARLHGAAPGPSTQVAEDRTGVAVLRPTEPGHALYVGGQWQAQLQPPATGQAAIGVVGPLLHPAPESVLLIGHGAGGTLFTLGTRPGIAHLHVVEIARPVLEVMRRHGEQGVEPVTPALLADPRIERTVADGRRVVLTDARRYDIVVAETVTPWTARSGFLFSREFFEAVRGRLAEGGLAVQWAPTERTVATFLDVFPHVVRLNQALVGSDRPIAVADAALRAQLLEGPVGQALARAGWDPAEVLGWLTAQPIQVWTPADPRPPAEINTDLFPRDEYWLS